MNNKIDTMAAQCWSHYIDGVLIDGHLHFDHKKFAQLIIQECVGVVAKDMDYNARWCGDKIKKHFGVD